MKNFARSAFLMATMATLAQAPHAVARTALNGTPPPDVKERAAWEQRFKKADKNKSGGLSRAELKKVDKNRFGLIRKHFKEMDADKNGEVTIAERDAYFKQKH